MMASQFGVNSTYIEVFECCFGIDRAWIEFCLTGRKSCVRPATIDRPPADRALKKPVSEKRR